MAFYPEHPKWDQNQKFTPLSEATSIPVTFRPSPSQKLYNMQKLGEREIGLWVSPEIFRGTFKWGQIFLENAKAELHPF